MPVPCLLRSARAMGRETAGYLSLLILGPIRKGVGELEMPPAEPHQTHARAEPPSIESTRTGSS